MKSIYFTYGLPRSGNTLLSCILNQNPKINTTANSILPSVMFAVEMVKLHDVVYRNFPDEESFNNILKNLRLTSNAARRGRQPLDVQTWTRRPESNRR